MNVVDLMRKRRGVLFMPKINIPNKPYRDAMRCVSMYLRILPAQMKTIDYTTHLMIWQNVGAGFTPAQMKTPQHKNMLGNRKGCPYDYTADLITWRNVGAYGIRPNENPKPLITPPI